MKYFLSFGNDRFKKSRSRIQKEAEATGLFDCTLIETEEICNEEPFKSVCEKYKTCGRGFYWYMWKPYIIFKILKCLKNGDILFYCDAGMKIYDSPNIIEKFKNLFELVQDKNKCPTGIATFITTGPPAQRKEYMYNMVHVFDHFSVGNDESITHTQQVQAGVHTILKCDKSIKIIEEWFELTKTNPEFFIGDKRFCKFDKTVQFEGFRDHRHDQSVWSILCKLNNVNILKHNLNPIYQSHIRE